MAVMKKYEIPKMTVQNDRIRIMAVAKSENGLVKWNIKLKNDSQIGDFKILDCKKWKGMFGTDRQKTYRLKLDCQIENFIK